MKGMNRAQTSPVILQPVVVITAVSAAVVRMALSIGVRAKAHTKNFAITGAMFSSPNSLPIARFASSPAFNSSPKPTAKPHQRSSTPTGDTTRRHLIASNILGDKDDERALPSPELVEAAFIHANLHDSGRNPHNA
ncbi:hypothetical protein FRC00_002014 [Tulasnella sp. 408]|nr:hypothetical protein FRC00_002014 [Tulasnella sp. 408]